MKHLLENLEGRLLLAAFESDDFHAATLNTAVWTFVNPSGDGSVAVNGTNARITVPAGNGHDAWSTNLAPRIMRPATNEDFEMEVKFESRPSGRYTMQGIIVEASAGNYLRFDFFSDGGSLRAFAASFSNGSAATKYNQAVPSTSDTTLYIRVKRQGTPWTQSYSLNGTTWTTAASFTHTLNVTKVGVFAGNEVGSGGAPAFTASVDYVFNTATPIVPEDGGEDPGPGDTTAPLISNIQHVRNTNQVQFSWGTDDVTTCFLDYGLTSAFELGSVPFSTASTNHGTTLNLQSFTNYFYRIRATNTVGLSSTSP